MQPVLKVDLTSREVTSFDIPQEWQRQYIGGSSLAARLLYEHLVPELDPLSPEAPLLFLTGPLTGTSGPTVGRFVVCAKSPATGLWGESNCGGFWGPELRKTGYDGIWISGRAEKPVYLHIEDEKVEILPADHLWGLDTYEIQQAIQDELGDAKTRVAGIGIAGENQLRTGLILVDHGRVAGRAGMGAVMGSKNLKAVAVRGHGSLPLYDAEKYKKQRTSVNKALRNDNITTVLREMGTASSSEYFDHLGEMPKRYFSRGAMEGVERISGASVAETILVGYSACHACVVACGRVVQLEENEEEQKGAEYETLVGFGPNLWLADPEFATRMGDLCDRYGMDTISVSNTIGLAFRLYELGIITDKDTGGIDLTWGDKDVVEKLIHMIPKREGFGAQLADGARALGKRYAAEDQAVQVNGLEVAYHDPRGSSGMALVYATSPRGACHNQSDYFLVDIGNVEDEIGMKFFDRHDGAEKSANVALHQNWRTVANSLVMCILGNVMPSETLSLVNSATGVDWGMKDLLQAGERGWTLKRVINNRLGLRRENDKLPKPLLEPYVEGGSAGFVIDFSAMLKAYYEARCWDWETGFPLPEKLSELDLGFALDALWPGK